MTRKLLAVALLLLLLAAVALPKTHRSAAARIAFQRSHPCPSTGKRSGRCPNHVIDHVIPLACGGPDTPSNMAWQTVADAKAKDKWERKSCSIYGKR